jgi:hypothetical protein
VRIFQAFIPLLSSQRAGVGGFSAKVENVLIGAGLASSENERLHRKLTECEVVS